MKCSDRADLFLWCPEMSQLSFHHLLNLSFAWHTRRKTGEILRILDRGAAINQTLEIILFNIIPTLFDIAIALVLFCYYFDWVLAMVIFFVMVAYSECCFILYPLIYLTAMFLSCRKRYSY